MKKYMSPQNHVFWYLPDHTIQPLTQNISTDVVIIGGGMAGLSAAQHFHEKGRDVVLLEKNYCGAGASGKSSGFITPGSELSLANLIHAYGKDGAKELWDFVVGGVHIIDNNIKKYSFECDYRAQNTLVVANTPHMFKHYIQQEYDMRTMLGYQSTLYTQEQLPSIINSDAYYGGIAYDNTFGINPYLYCQHMKKILSTKGVRVYEETPALSAAQHVVTTPQARVKARHIVLCLDQFLPTLNKLTYEVYHAQTFILLSAPLSKTQVQSIFPAKTYMMWDTDLVYQYFRLTEENRFLIGGSSELYTFAKHEIYNSHMMYKKLTSYITKKFPNLDVTFEYMWPGLIGISKDLVPIVGYDKNDPSLYYITAATGLPWAAALGRYSAECIVDNNKHMEKYFSPYRRFLFGHALQTIFGKKISFAVSNYLRVR